MASSRSSGVRADRGRLGEELEAVEPLAGLPAEAVGAGPDEVGLPELARPPRARPPGQVALPASETTASGAPTATTSRSRATDGRQGRQGRLAPAPPPGAFRAADGPRPDRLAGPEPPQVLGQGVGAGVAPRRLLLQAFQADRLQVARQPRLQPRRRDRLGRLDLLERLQRRRRPERRPAGQQLVEDRPQGVDVGRRADRRGPALRPAPGPCSWACPGRDPSASGPTRRPATWPGRSRRSWACRRRRAGRWPASGRGGRSPAGAPRGWRGPASRPAGPRRGPARGCRRGGRPGCRRRRTPARSTGGRRWSPTSIDLDDVRVLQPGDRLGLGQEADGGLGPGVVAGQDHLEGDDAVEPELPGLVDDAHAAAAQLPEDLVAGDLGEGPPSAGRPAIRHLPAVALPVMVARATCSGSSPRYLGKRPRYSSSGEVGFATPAQPVLGGDQPEHGGAVAGQFRVAGQVLLDPGGFPGLEAQLQLGVHQLDEQGLPRLSPDGR